MGICRQLGVGFLALVCFINLALANIQEFSLQVSDEHAVAYNYIPAQSGKPTLVLLNGLIYSLKNWDNYINELTSKGYGVVLVAYSTQPESLRYIKSTPYYSKITTTVSGLAQTGLEIKDLANDVMMVVDHLKIDQFHLQALSFGSIVGSYIANEYTSRVQSVTLIAPAVMSSHRYTPYGESRHTFYVMQNAMNINPFYVPDYYYDLELYQTMSMTILTQYNTLDLDGTSYEDVFNGVYQMARSTKYFDLKEEAESAWPRTSLFIAENEDPSLKADQLKYWNAKKSVTTDSYLIQVENAPHAIPGSHFKTLAETISEILEGTKASGEYKVVGESKSSTGTTGSSSTTSIFK